MENIKSIYAKKMEIKREMSKLKKPEFMSNTNTSDNSKYELQQDYVHPFGKTHKGTVKTYEEWKRTFPKLEREDLDIKDDWFKLKEQENNSKRYEVLMMCYSNKYSDRSELYSFKVNKNIPKEKYEAVKKAIELTLNNEITLEEAVQEYLHKDIPTLDRQLPFIQKENIPDTKGLQGFLKSAKEKQDNLQQKDWEILALRYKKDGNVYPFTTEPDENFTIHRVKRLSDNTVFAVGDELINLGMHGNEIHKISAIKEINGTLAFCYVNGGEVVLSWATKKFSN